MTTESQYSIDPFLEKVWLVTIFWDDFDIGTVHTISDYDSAGRLFKGGDTVHLRKTDENGDTRETLAVVLGCGETEADANSNARNYVKRVGNWHGDGSVELLGCDLSQSQLFQDVPPVSNEEDSQNIYVSEAEEDQTYK